MELLTNSRMSKFRRCPRAHFYRYECELARSLEAEPLRMGSAFHRGMEVHNLRSATPVVEGGADGDADHAGSSAYEAVMASTVGYDICPHGIAAADWEMERSTVAALVCGHIWRYGQDGVKIVDVEMRFEIPLMNPETGAVSRTFRLAGKMDAVAQLPDGRLALVEYKTAGEEIGPDADYWLRLRCDPQISLYYEAAPSVAHEVTTILYDVTRKPTIGPRNVPVVDDKGIPIVLDHAGKGACPPEDCGGVWGYYDMLDALADPKHERHEELIEWLDGPFDPEAFDLDEVNKILAEWRNNA